MTTLRGTVEHFIFSPKGAYEGVLLETPKGPAQVVFPKDQGTDVASHLTLGSEIKLSVKPIDDHRPRVHPVFELAALPHEKSHKSGPVKVSGKVARLNYARHGEVNGAILDSGDFVHSKPHGAVAVKFKVGLAVHAEGEARPMRDGAHRVIEATKVNGIAIHKPSKKH